MKRILFVLLVLSSILLFGCSNNVSVNFMVNDEVISTIEIKNGKKIIEPEEPELEGHSLDGWYYNNKKWDFDKDVSSSDITLVAKFSPKEYTITIDKDNGEDVEQKTFKYGETVMIDVPLKSGYIFNGWDQELPSEMPSKDLSIKALWVSLIDAKLQFEDKLFINEEQLLKVTDANGEKELGNITFKSTDNDIAYVFGNKVIGISSGSCKIQAIYNYNVILEKTIYVIDKTEQKKIEEAAIGLILPSDQFEEDILLPNKVASLYSVKWEIEDNNHCKVLYANQTTQYLKILENYEWSNGLKLTATVYGANEGVQVQKVFTIYVRMRKVESFTIKDIMESIEVNIEVSLTGTVYYVCPQGFWLTDETGYTIYVYGSDVAKNVKQGDKVKATGTKILYYSMFEIEKSTVEVLEEGNGAFDLSSMIKDNAIDVISTYEKEYRYEYGRIYRIQGEIIKDPNDKYTYAIKNPETDKYVVFYDSVMVDSYTTKTNLENNFGKYVTIDVLVWDHYSTGFIRVLPVSKAEEVSK